jgi:hypothetical protein
VSRTWRTRIVTEALPLVALCAVWTTKQVGVVTDSECPCLVFGPMASLVEKFVVPKTGQRREALGVYPGAPGAEERTGCPTEPRKCLRTRCLRP